MTVREDVKQLLAKEAKTMTWLASKMSEMTNKKYTMKSISDKLARRTLQYEEFLVILRILGYKMEFRKLKVNSLNPD